MSSVPDPIPSDWLHSRLLPSDLATLDELRRRYADWTPPKREQVRDASGLITTLIRMPSGRVVSSPIDGVPLDPVDELVADLHEFAAQSGILLFDDWCTGDELWLFNSPRAMWSAMAGRAGYVWLRNGKNYHAHCTLVS